MVAMSGGVDSSVAAYILKQQGYECVGATMLLHGQAAEGESADIRDAKAVAGRLGIEHYIFDLREEFEERVIQPFIDAYVNGRTPNPCVFCNRQMKFRALQEKAEELGCDLIATGHYARLEKPADPSEEGARCVLRKSAIPEKDQSYVLCMLTQEQLSKSLFPLEGMAKDEVRRIAGEIGLAVADKPDSQDICFVPDGRYAEFIEAHERTTFPEGDYCDEEGNIVGRHKGIIRYTIGQRKGLGIALGRPVFVKTIDPETNRVILSDNDALFTDTLRSGDFNWVSIAPPMKPIHAKARIRYQHAEQPAVILPAEDGSVTIRFEQPQRAITPGQTVAVYENDILLGGGTID